MDHTIDLIQKSHEGDEEARARLVEENAGLVWCIVKRFHNRGVETEDLFQIGNIGLIKAIDKFDLSYDVKFSTYAVPMISGEIKRFLRDDGMIKVSRSLKELANFQSVWESSRKNWSWHWMQAETSSPCINLFIKKTDRKSVSWTSLRKRAKNMSRF